jgi:cytochrome c peroxidase
LPASVSSDTADYVTIDPYPNVTNTFSGKIDLNKLQNYANQTVPAYITKDNTVGNVITDKGATLGRVLFYDNSLSSTNAACASCHIQANAFGDGIASDGINGSTTNAMRLINSRFAKKKSFGMKEQTH